MLLYISANCIDRDISKQFEIGVTNSRPVEFERPRGLPVKVYRVILAFYNTDIPGLTPIQGEFILENWHVRTFMCPHCHVDDQPEEYVTFSNN
jgi:hypothetical protein